jgi:predicted MFS family arabinose efflux permease
MCDRTEPMRNHLDQKRDVAEPRDVTAAIVYAGLIALAVAVGIGRFAFTPLLPMMHEDAGLSIAAGGWLASANYLGYLLGALSAMRLRWRSVAVIRGGLIMIGVVTGGMGLVDSFAVWVLFRALAGVASAWVLIFASTWCLARLAPRRRPVLHGLVFAGVGASITAVGVLCIVLMHAHVRSAHAWIIFGVLSLVLSVAIWPAFGAGDDARAPEVRHAAVGVFTWESDSIRLVLCYGAFGFGYIIPATFLPVMAKQAMRDPAVFGWSWPLFGGAALVSTLAAAVVPRSISHRHVWIMSHLVMACGVALPVVWPGIIATMCASLCVGGTFMVTTMVAMQEAREAAGQHATGLIAAMTAAFACGQIIGPLSVSSVISLSGNFSVALLIACALLVLSAYALSRHPGS